MGFISLTNCSEKMVSIHKFQYIVFGWNYWLCDNLKSREACASKKWWNSIPVHFFGWNHWHVVVNILTCDVWEQGMGSWGRKTNTRVCRLLEVKERFSACRKEKLSATRVPLKESKITLSRFTVETVLWQYHDVMLCEISFFISIELYECCLQSNKPRNWSK